MTRCARLTHSDPPRRTSSSEHLEPQCSHFTCNTFPIHLSKNLTGTDRWPDCPGRRFRPPETSGFTQMPRLAKAAYVMIGVVPAKHLCSNPDGSVRPAGALTRTSDDRAHLSLSIGTTGRVYHRLITRQALSTDPPRPHPPRPRSGSGLGRPHRPQRAPEHPDATPPGAQKPR